MKINEELLRVIRASDLDVSEALLFCFAVSQPEYDLVDKLSELLLTEENEYMYRINLVQHGDDGIMKLRYPLYSDSDTTYRSRFSEYINRLVTRPDMSIHGHVNNIKSYVVINGSKEAEQVFNSVFDNTVDLDRLIDATIQYYRDTEYCKVLHKFLEESAKMMYDTFKESKSNMI